MEVHSVQMGPETTAKLEVVDGKVKISVAYDGKQADAGLHVTLEVKQFLEMLKKAIPGELDDVLIDGLAKALL